MLADRGYFEGNEILEWSKRASKIIVPKPLTSNSRADGRFDKRDFAYVAKP